MSVNLAEGIALSHKLMRFAGAAAKSRDQADPENLDAESQGSTIRHPRPDSSTG